MSTRKVNHYDRRITAGVVLLVVFGSFMIASAEMGNAVGDTGYLTSVIIKQAIFAVLGLVGYFLACRIPLNRMRLSLYNMAYTILLITLLACRLFGATNGAYAWIPIGSLMSIQPSEFAKAFMMVYAARLLSRDQKEKNLSNFIRFGVCTLIYVGVILVWQKDLGSAMVLFVMCYCMMLIPSYKEIKKYQSYMLVIILGVLVIIPLILSPFFTDFLKNFSSNYMVGRFLAAADPFLYRYDNGYHLVMSLVSFANGGLFGLGYTKSIHKYMNFPNPSNDFILPVIVEELGIVGFLVIIIGYALILYPMISFSLKTEKISGKIVAIGSVCYFLCHFIFNVGGVSGFIPLTGVPLLIVSSGGSSLIACLASVGMVQNEMAADMAIEEDESNSW
ncbi:MAG: FtsW/RodA/SpoVE family cell cycle protein [Erysipelotrichaceae bacterium]|nr:FtsW/RodA/SpoVE family cell cycle protein [Erysipelotrichaceae bacterium]